MNTNIYKKKTLALLLGFCFVATTWLGCKKETDVFEPTLMAAHDLLEVSGRSSEQYLEFLSNSAWMISTDVDWISFDVAEGEKGKHKIKFVVADNEEGERMGVIFIKTQNGLEQEIQVHQEAGEIHIFYVKPEGTGEGRSWEGATTLQNALDMATSGSTIHIAAGIYNPTKTISNGDEADDGDKTFEIRSNVTLIGGYPADPVEGMSPDPEVNKTIFSGQQSNGNASYHVVAVTAPVEQGEKVTMKGITITEGHGSDRGTRITIGGNGYSRGNGAGMIIGGSVVELHEISIIENKTSSEKGSVGQAAGLFIFAGAEVTIKNCKISDNNSASNGGGLWVDRAKAFVFDSEINGNIGGTAAGVHAYPDATLYMYNCQIAFNKGKSYGAGVYLRQNSKGVLVNCLIADNESTSANGGGGVMLYDNSEIDIISSTIANNDIAGPGGGVYRRSGNNKLRIINSIISGNKQVNNSTDVDAYEANALAPSLISSIVATKVYDGTGSDVANTAFSVSSMLSDTYHLIGEDNPALKYGMGANDLMSLINQFTPPLSDKEIVKDLENKSREGKTVIGAYTQ